MAASTFSPGGFSYAQAAKGRSSAGTSQTPSSKVTSGTASPATGTFSELTPSSNWADDVESDVKASEVKESKQATQAAPAVQTTEADENKPADAKEAAVEPVKSEEIRQPEATTISSPDMTASTSMASQEEEVGSSIPNASASETTWESKSSSSTEPAWIADRTARQNNASQSDKDGKKEKKQKEAPAPAPVAPIVLQEAPIPENIWTKRAAVMSQQSKATPTPAKPAVLPKKENQKPMADVPAKPTPLQNGSISEQPQPNGDEQSKLLNQASKRVTEVRGNHPRQTARPVTQGSRSDSPLVAGVKDLPNGRKEPIRVSVPPPSVNDAVSWPTPDLAEKERKEPAEKDKVEKADDDATPATKRKKQGWTHIAVTPTYLFETTGTNKPHERRSHPPTNSDGAPRGGAGGRGGRGGLRRANGAERPPRPDFSPTDEKTEIPTTTTEAAEKKDRAVMPPPLFKPTRGSSIEASQNRGKDPSPVQAVNGHRAGQSRQQDDTLTDSSSGVSASNGTFARSFGDDRRNKNQKKTDSESKEEGVPKPIPPRSSVTAETVGVENGQKPARGPPPIRKVAVDNRQETREAVFPSPLRGNKRNGRGRGGARELANGHNGASPMNGNYDPSSYAVPQSPSNYHSARGNHQYAHPSPRGGSYGGNTRTQSMANDPYFNPRYGPYHGAQPNYSQMQPFWPGVFDVNGYPMSAPPYPMPFDMNFKQDEELRHQIEYYFSEENLVKDTYLRSQMDSQGFVFFDVIANFNRVKQYTQERDYIKSICMGSENIDVRVGDDGRERLRKNRDWEKWVLQMDQRHESAKTDGPENLTIPDQPRLALNNIPPQFRGPQSAGLPGRQHFVGRSYDSGMTNMDPYAASFYAYPNYPPEMYGGPVAGEETRGRTQRSPMHETVVSPVQQQAATPGSGVAAENELSSDCDVNALTVVVNMGELRSSPHPVSTRTFSNGSIDSRSTLPELEASSATKSKPTTNGDSQTNDAAAESSTAMSSPTKTTPGEGANSVFWVKDREFPLGNLPRGLSSYPYLQLKEEALQQRAEGVTGTCPAKLSILYQFWCHFLIRNFNTGMYEEFQRLANEDARDRYNFVGLQNLVKFYSQSLTSKNHPLRDRVAKDYVDLVNEAPKGMKDAPFKELRTAWRNGALNLKNRKKLADILDPTLKNRLDDEKPTTPAVEASNPLAA